MSKIANPTKVITGVNTRRSYANVWDPKSINGAAPKYSVSLIIPKSDTVTVNKIKAAIQAAYEEGESKLKGTAKVCPALDVIKTPLRDGDKAIFSLLMDDPQISNALKQVDLKKGKSQAYEYVKKMQAYKILLS